MIKGLFFISLFCLFVCGCAAPAPSPNAAGDPSASGNGLSPAAAALKARLTNTDNGLEVRRWVIADRPDRLAQALLKHADGLAANESALQRLKRNGFRMVRVPADQIESLLADLGGATYDATEWHGQVVQWRSLVDRPVEGSGQAVAIDGMVQRFETGVFRLMIRSWSVLMEDGPRLYLEMAPRRHLPQANNLRKLLGDESDIEQSFDSAALDLLLDSNYVYVIVSQSPNIDWPGIDGELATQASPSASSSHRGMMDVGPEALPPPTLGELLLASPTSAETRGILVLVPKIAPDMFLPEQQQAAAALKRQRTRIDQQGTGDS